MIKINNIKKLKNDRYLVEIIKKDIKIPHIISENTLIKHNLLTTDTLTNDEYKKIIKHNEYELLYLKAINYISYQMRTISEVKKHLKKDTQDESLINKIIAELKKHKYVNDLHYVDEYVTQKLEFDLVGPRYIKDKLVLKGIHYELIDSALLRYSEDMQFDKINDILDKELRYKLKKPYKKVYMSLKQKLVTKGYTLSVIESSLLSRKDDILKVVDEDSLIKKDVQKLKKDYDIKVYEQKQKVMKKLLTKGYNYETIKKHIV
jgi:regulatory protein